MACCSSWMKLFRTIFKDMQQRWLSVMANWGCQPIDYSALRSNTQSAKTVRCTQRNILTRYGTISIQPANPSVGSIWFRCLESPPANTANQPSDKKKLDRCWDFPDQSPFADP
jgi:hypothetical protein